MFQLGRKQTKSFEDGRESVEWGERELRVIRILSKPADHIQTPDTREFSYPPTPFRVTHRGNARASNGEKAIVVCGGVGILFSDTSQIMGSTHQEVPLPCCCVPFPSAPRIVEEEISGFFRGTLFRKQSRMESTTVGESSPFARSARQNEILGPVYANEIRD